METDHLEKNIKEIFEGGKYVIPLYQRNYAWRENEIVQLLQDVYESFKKNKCGNYFIGSLVVLRRQNGDFEVIDGQQRLTTMSLITRILDISKNPCLFYDSRPEVEEFFKEFYKDCDIHDLDYPQIIHLKNAVGFIKESNLDENVTNPVTLQELVKDKDFVDFFANNVKLVRVEIPEDTDVASYFEIMNNRGVQLKKHEILKSLLMAKLNNEADQKEFAYIWDACSQMDTPIQRNFNADLRRKYFGDSYDEFRWEAIFENYSEVNSSITSFNMFSISDVLQGKTDNQLSDIVNENDGEIEEEASEYKSIIDFPNFLMHVFKLKYETSSREIQLNEKYLLEVYSEIESQIDPKDFIKSLFFFRTIFDRFIVKTISDQNVEDEIKWTLHKPSKYSTSWKYINSFGDTEDASRQERIVKAISMLQVTFRTRIYKNWLQDILKWFKDEKKDVPINEITAIEYQKLLDNLILKYYKEREFASKPIPENEDICRSNSYFEGTNTPHFIFNFIDYLYWVDSKNPTRINRINTKYEIKDFEFKYWNSVEHHMAREWAERNEIANRDNFIDCLGNLCLISKGSNSRLSDRDVKEKVQSFGNGNIGAKRQVMYAMSKDSEDKYTWTETKIKEHYKDLMRLIENRNEILGIDLQ